MQKILRKRLWRDFRKNFLRYMALSFLIILGMYIIVSLVGAADTVIQGVDGSAEKLHMEDGEFTVFVPLSEKEEKKLTKLGISLQKMFYLDFTRKSGNTLRIFKNRQKINQIDLDEGELADRKNEAVLEKRYCEEHHIKVGDKIQIGGNQFQVTGVGSVPDYDAPYRNLSDSSVDSKQFGIAFVTNESYQELLKSGKSDKSEEYVYAYRLNGKMTNNALKEKLKKIKVSSELVEDQYFQEYWEETGGKKDELEKGIEDLVKGTKELKNALSSLNDYKGSLNEGTEKIWNSYLSEANNSLKSVGVSEKLTESNFEQVLINLKESSDNAIFRLSIGNLFRELKSLKEYKDGVKEYTESIYKTSEGAEELNDGMQELEKNTDDFLKAFGDGELDNLTQFLTAEDNPRIGASADDQIINKMAGLLAGVIIMILFTYVISVFVIHGIERESEVIGALYALGIKKKDLLLHYLILPTVITFASGCIGTLIGYSRWGVNVQMKDCYDYFSVPVLHTVYSPYLLVYGIIMPPIIAVFVNWIVIRKRLSKPALTLIRGDQKEGKIKNISLGNLGFLGRFRVRQMLREARTGLTIIFGMFISLLILMLGINCYVLCEHISKENKEDTKYEYMYTYKYPEKEVPSGGEACYAKTLKKEIFGYNLDVTLLGIDEKNPYFDADISKKKNEVIISSAMAQKYGLSVGEKVILTDEEADMDYAFTIKGITQYSVGMYAFMDIDAMREFFDEDQKYYNVVLSDHALKIPSGRLYATTTKEEISKSSDVFTDLMMPMVFTMTIVAAFIFCMVMYLMMKVMIDRSAFSISLMKVFGYRPKEIRKLYLNGNFYIVAIGAAVCLPLSKWMMDAVYPILVSNVACGINLTFSWQLYLEMYGGILLLYLLMNRMLIQRIHKVIPADVLKNRE